MYIQDAIKSKKPFRSTDSGYAWYNSVIEVNSQIYAVSRPILSQELAAWKAREFYPSNVTILKITLDMILQNN